MSDPGLVLPQKTAIYALTPQGMLLGLRLAEASGSHLFLAASLPETERKTVRVVRFERLPAQVAENFRQYALHIFVSAAGIAVRCLAPLLRSKASDPAVLVLDQKADFVISLLSGHLGGANACAAAVAEFLGAVPIISTATDLENLPALDLLAREKRLIPADAAAFAPVSAALLAGQRVGLHDPDGWLGLADQALFYPLPGPHPAPPCVLVTETTPAAPKGCLILHPPVLYAGIGLRRGAPAASILQAIRETLDNRHLARQALAALASVEAKQDEPGLIRAAQDLALPLIFFPADVLKGLPVSSPSPKALEALGLLGVCEPAALAAAAGLSPENPPLRGLDPAAILLSPKRRFPQITIAIARRGQALTRKLPHAH
ncbi:MAG: cobalamin biosynthesis protein [Deltaproteobacteria bacterium]|jgi:cobalamin biosynthesis protein CbiG|nr:cobalamin biosynthesis protein [Deltaproteobacteria bacterium]